MEIDYKKYLSLAPVTMSKLVEGLHCARDNLASAIERLTSVDDKDISAKLSSGDYFVLTGEKHEDLVQPELQTVDLFIQEVMTNYIDIVNIAVNALDMSEQTLNLYRNYQNICNVTTTYRQSTMDDRVQREKRRTREVEFRSKVRKTRFIGP